MARPASWVPPVAWMVVILLLSTELGSAEQTAGFLGALLRTLLPWVSPVGLQAIHTAIRKGAHVTEYAVLAVLWYRALAGEGALGGRRAVAAALAIAGLWAFVDEAHQTMQPARTGSLADVALDSAGGLLGALGAHVGWTRFADAAAGLLLLVALVGGAGVIGLNLATGVPSGVLWLTVPGAAVALLVRRRRAGRPPRAVAAPGPPLRP
jgi:VanZ family protein